MFPSSKTSHQFNSSIIISELRAGASSTYTFESKCLEHKKMCQTFPPFIRYVYQYAHHTIVSQRKLNRLPITAVKYLNCAILINPDVSTFWNVRRHLVERVQLSITQEFQFSALVLSKKPKSSEAFFYRRWLFSFQST